MGGVHETHVASPRQGHDATALPPRKLPTPAGWEGQMTQVGVRASVSPTPPAQGLAPAVAAKFVSGASPDLTGAMSLTTGRAVMIGKPPFGIIETAVGAALTLNLSGAVQTSGFVVYALVT